MAELMTRGNAILGAAGHLDRICDPRTRGRVRAATTPELQAALPTMTRNGWYPRRMFIEVLHHIASVNNERDRSYEDLAQAGSAIAEDASNTFLKLLLRMATPRLFGAKFPDFWARDLQGGHPEVDTSRVRENRMVIFFKDVEHFDHIGPAGAGFIRFGLRHITGKYVRVTTHGWSLENPGPPEIRQDISW
jgi:hypothetical protein